MMNSEANRVGEAIRAEISAQGFDADKLAILNGVILYWDGIGLAAIKATDHVAEVKEIFDSAAKRIVDYDRRKAAGEDVSKEVRPRMPGGSDW